MRTAPRGKSLSGTDGPVASRRRFPGGTHQRGTSPPSACCWRSRAARGRRPRRQCQQGTGVACHDPAGHTGEEGQPPTPQAQQSTCVARAPQEAAVAAPGEQRTPKGQLFPPLPPDTQRTKPQSGHHGAPPRLHLGRRHRLLAVLGSLDSADSKITDGTHTLEKATALASLWARPRPWGQSAPGLAGTGSSATPDTFAKGFGTLRGEETSTF